jgi:ribosomal protein L16 Arg81 hydroxylase
VRRSRAGRPPTRTTTTWTPTLTTRTPTSTPTTRASSAELALCLDPVAAGEFLADHWEQQPLVVPREEPGRFDHLLSTADVERLLCSTGLRYPAFRLVKAGEQLDVRGYTVDLPWRPVPFTGVADVERVAAEFEAGATVVLQALHLNWQPLARFCRALERELGHPVQANAYYTPRRSQGLGVHHDTHDVFVLQVAGEKRWLVYDPVLELPLRDQRYSADLGGPGEPVHDVTLGSGDTLYLPRGWLHEALTSESDSLHLTIGVNVYTWLDAFKAAIEDCADELPFRRSVGTDGRPEELLDLLENRLAPEDVAQRMRERFVRGRRPILDGQLGQLRALDDLTPETPVERRASVIADLREENGLTVLEFEGKRVAFPAQAQAEVAFAATADGTFSASELPGGLDDEGRLVLLRRLVREGFLRLTNPSGSDGPSPRSDGAA